MNQLNETNEMNQTNQINQMNQIGPEFAPRPMVGLFRLKVARNCPNMAVSGARIVTYRSTLRTGWAEAWFFVITLTTVLTI